MKGKGRAALQFNRPGKPTQGLQKKKKTAASSSSKTRARAQAVVRRPWATPQFEELAKEGREIVLDRVRMEVAPLPAVRAHVVAGANSVARALERGQLGVVVLASNPEGRFAAGHLPLACRLRGVPVCVLHLSSKALGELIGLKSLAAFGIRKPALPEPFTGGEPDGQVDANQPESEEIAVSKSTEASIKLSPADREKLQSITEFLQSKASKKACEGGS